MAKFEQRDNNGILFKNNRKEQPQHPDYNGSATIDGVEYWMNAWLKDGKNGKFMSFSFKPKQGKVKLRVVGDNSDMDDAVPF